MNKRTIWITRTALFLAVVIMAQFIGSRMTTGGLLGQFVTGSLVNMALVVSAVIAGVWSGLAIACLSPILAFFMGIGPAFVQILPIIIIGNAVYVLLTWYTVRLVSGQKRVFIRQASTLLGFIASAAVKMLVLWVGVVKLVLPMLTTLKPAQVNALSLAFSWPQFVTGTIGGFVAIVIIPSMLKVRSQSGN